MKNGGVKLKRRNLKSAAKKIAITQELTLCGYIGKSVPSKPIQKK
jgi:hypothetical protein